MKAADCALNAAAILELIGIILTPVKKKAIHAGSQSGRNATFLSLYIHETAPDPQKSAKCRTVNSASREKKGYAP